MQNKFVKVFTILGIFTVISWLMAFGCLVWAGETPKALLAKMETGLNGDQEQIHDSKNYSPSDVSNVKVEAGSADVEVTESADGDIQVDLTGHAPKGTQLEVEQEKGEVSVKIQKPKEFSVHFQMETESPHLHVVLPKSYRGGVAIKAGSGDIHGVDLELSQLSTHAGSGDIALSGKFVKLVAEAGSGNLSLRNVKSDTLEASTGSGDISLANISAHVARAEAGSGKVDVKLGDLKQWTATASTGSGDISAEIPTTEQRHGKHEFTAGHGQDQITVETGSGDIHLSL